MNEEKNIEKSSKPQAASDKPVEKEEQHVIGNKQLETSQPQTTNYKPETSDMEVHKHPHHVTHKKKFGEYLLEFFMLFLAVFLGFLAENFREHQVEKERGKQYIESFYEDLKTDTARLNYLINFETKKIETLNVLQSCYDSVLNNQAPLSLINIIKNSLSNNPFQRNERTLQQLSNAGGFRLLKKEDADSIISYQTDGNRVKEYQSTLYQQSQDNLRNALNDAIDFTSYSSLYSDVANNPLPDANEIKNFLFISHDKAVLNKYFNTLFQYLRVIVQHRNGLKRLNEDASRQLDYFKNKYRLE